MASFRGKRIDTGQGIVVEATVDHLRHAAKEVLWEYKEIEETPPDIERSSDGVLKVGEALIFREDIETCPAEIVAVKLGMNKLWYILSSHNCPPEKCATAREAMKCAQSEEKRLKKFRQVIEGTKGTRIQEIEKWGPDKLSDAQDILEIISDASRRYSH